MIFNTQKYKCQNRTFQVLRKFMRKEGVEWYEVEEVLIGHKKSIHRTTWNELMSTDEIELCD